MATIYCLCPDFKNPSGGTRTLYWYVHQLCQQGYDAWIVHQQLNFRLIWHGIEVPITSLAANPNLEQGDIVISPEGMLSALKSLGAAPVHKVALVLAWHPSYLTIEPKDTWEDYGVQAVLTQSEIISQYLAWRLSLPVTVVKPYLDPEKYYGDTKSTVKQPLIAYSPRKCHDASIVQAALYAKGDRFSSFRWQSMVDLKEDDYAQCLRQATVYVPPSNHEGVNISVLEAMACGCLVVGYHGVGGKEFMVGEGPQQNCILVENGNLPELGKTLETVLSRWQNNPAQYEAIVNNAIETAQRYQDKALEARELAHFFDAVLQLPVHQLSAKTTAQLATYPRKETPIASATHGPAVSSVPATPLSDEVMALVHRATQLKNAGQLAAASTAYQEALSIDRSQSELWFNYGNLLQQIERQPPEAVLAEDKPADQQTVHLSAKSAFEQAIALKPDFFQAHLNLANALRDCGEYNSAIAHYQQVITLQPGFTLAYRNLGQLLIKLQKPQPALQVFADWCRLAPQDPTPLNGLGVALQSQGKHEKAIAAFQKALSLDPNRFDSLNNLGTLLRMIKRPHDALPYLHKAIEQDSTSDIALSNLVHTLLGLGQIGEALTKTQHILDQHPQSASGHLMRGFALVQQAQIVPALKHFERVWEIEPSSHVSVSNALFTMLYRDDMSGAEFVAERQKWVDRLPQPQQRYRQWQGSRDPGRRLKVGYLSGDLRSHPVAFFLEPILSHHNAEQVELYCYDVAGVEDATTTRLKGYAHHWRNCVGTSDEALATQIHTDGIDCLVDLSGHTAGNRSGVLQRKPAPIQIMYIGYPGSTGLDTVDYIISDKWVSPPEQAALYTEKILPVEGSFWCFRPHEFAPLPNALPAANNGYITFGSFNHSTKLSPATMKLWARVLQAVPTARLKLKSLAMGDESTCDYFRQQLVGYGVDPARLIFEGPTLKLEDFFESYHTIDIALDPTPYNGGTTTCEALWMGVPVVTLRGDRFCSRMSHSLLNNVGLGMLSARNEAKYIDCAVALAADLERLQEIRRGMRSRMAASLICNATLASAALEKVYRQAWHNYCQT